MRCCLRLWLIFAFLTTITCSKIIEKLNFENNQLSNQPLHNLLQRLRQETNYDTILRLATSTSACAFNDVLRDWRLPILNYLATQFYDFEYRKKFSSNILILNCAAEFQSWRELQTTKSLRSLSNAHQVVQLDKLDASILQQLCLECFRLDIYNLIAVESGNFYACRKYANSSSRPAIKRITLNQTEKFFAPKFLNMHGATITVMPDNAPPHVKLHKGKLHGYVSKIVTTYAALRNATLSIQVPNPDQPPQKFILEAVQNSSLDIGVGPFYYLLSANTTTSYPFDTVDGCMMIPLPQYMPIETMFLRILSFSVTLLILLLIPLYGLLLDRSLYGLFGAELTSCEKSLRALLGQAFPFPRQPKFLTSYFVCFQLCYASLVINTSYQAFLHSWKTERPLEARIQTFDDMVAANLKIYFYNNTQLHELIAARWAAYPKLQLVPGSPEKMAALNQYLDNRYAYIISSPRWLIFQEQQKYFQRPLFFYSRAHCLVDLTPLQFPVRQHLPFLDLLNTFILRVHEVGLYKHWIGENFFELVRQNELQMKDMSLKLQFDAPLALADLSLIFSLQVVCLAFALLVFFVEVIIARLK